HGILYIEREESYTSKASFLSEDFIPTYTPKKEKDEGGEASAELSDQEKQKYSFSGTRKGRLYHDNRLDITVNADIQGSANIGRKEFPTLFVAKSCDIQNPPVIYRHPDLKPVAQRIICK
ncbi:MAG: hypothetical protein IJ083_04215, partial [Clostridia bacterium]|nr:hypothetical protein [Clostridia bacterium]